MATTAVVRFSIALILGAEVSSWLFILPQFLLVASFGFAPTTGPLPVANFKVSTPLVLFVFQQRGDFGRLLLGDAAWHEVDEGVGIPVSAGPSKCWSASTILFSSWYVVMTENF